MVSMEDYCKTIQDFSVFSSESHSELELMTSLRNFGKNEFVLQEGAICNDHYFVFKGCQRIFYLKDCNEISERFAFEDTF